MTNRRFVADRHENTVELTKTTIRITTASPVLPRLLLSRAVLVRCVLIPNFVEEMDLILVCEQSSPNTVDRCITPPLMNRVSGKYPTVKRTNRYKPRSRNLLKLPDSRHKRCKLGRARSPDRRSRSWTRLRGIEVSGHGVMGRVTYNDRGYTLRRRCQRGNPWHSLQLRIRDGFSKSLVPISGRHLSQVKWREGIPFVVCHNVSMVDLYSYIVIVKARKGH